MQKFGLFGRFLVDKEDREELSEILLEAAKAMGDVEGCEVYQVSLSNEEPQAVYVYEVWKDEAAHQASLALEVTQTLIHRAKPLITGMERLNTLQTLGGLGMDTD
ncbi:putative quinol monooxygenase [Terribacillus sp. 7520-G]|uniref:putative quinol monooxygenase n=1 Tax=Terribacillus TaxID=459532 RepID=UPI000BA7941B|nr:putative quinol monooxygenase [Terribacillus sp. 7520-G]PAD38350.1 antibiotic biosynthesis monooxygenase [Terribacillus sp. 7520-G]